MSYRSHTAAPSRVFDHLYDPIFTTSDQRNIQKEDCVALMRSAPIQIYPVLDSMFSEMSYEERNCYAYQKNTLPFTPSYSRHVSRRSLCVTGADRSKFFKNPINNVQTINVGLMADESISITNLQVNINTTGVQTIYRESSAQTRPFLPECYANEIIDDQNVPEVAYIAEILSSVKYPGVKEVEIIERSRKRRQWENSLPPMLTPEDIASRAGALEVFEWEEWITREREINECQQARLQIVADLIMKREKKQKSINEQKIEHCRMRALRERNRQKDLLLRKYQRNMRKLDLSKRKEAMGDKKTDPVLSHFDRKNDYSFPKINMNVTSKKHPQIEYTEKLEESFDALDKDSSSMLEDLQKFLNSKPKVALWKPKGQKKEIEKGIWNENYLKNLHNTLKLFRFKKLSQRKNPKIYKELAADPFVDFKGSDESTDQNYKDKVLIQKTLKGRSIQNMLQKGIKNFREIIEEASIEFSQHIQGQKLINLELKQIEDSLKNDRQLQDDLNKIESKDTKGAISFLEKEIQRLQVEKRSHALFMLAERERYYREAATFIEKSELDKIFKNDTISLYLENVLIEGINATEAEESSREFVRKLTRKIDQIASIDFKLENQQENELSCEIVSEDSFKDVIKDQVFPHIIDRMNNELLRAQQNIFLEKAHKEIFREEFLLQEIQEQEAFCTELVNEIIENAMDENFIPQNLSRQESLEAEVLATKIVEKILNEITLSELETTDETSASPTGTESESSTDILAKQVVHNVLTDVLEDESSTATQDSTPESTEPTEDGSEISKEYSEY